MTKINNIENTFEYGGDIYPLMEDTDITEDVMQKCIEDASIAVKEILIKSEIHANEEIS